MNRRSIPYVNADHDEIPGLYTAGRNAVDGI